MNIEAQYKLFSELNSQGSQRELGLSAIIPVFGCQYVDRFYGCLESLSRQTCNSFEIIVVLGDGISFDDTLFKDPRIQIVYENGNSPSILRNKGFLHSNYCFVTFIDADIIIPNYEWATLIIKMLHSSKTRVLTALPRRRIINRKINLVLNEYLTGEHIENLIEPIHDWLYIKKGMVVPELVFNNESGYLRYAEIDEVRQANSWPEEYRGTVFRGSIWGGFLALESNLFSFVGGYCELFEGWGDEDAELLTRLDHLISVDRLYTYEALAVYHMDHELPHRKLAHLTANRALRITRGVCTLENLIRNDYCSTKSSVLNSIKHYHPMLDKLR